jgi:DNA-binding transcriptional LysR family regulator
MDLEIRQYRYFAVLVEELHFGRAAERLGISQPALSQQFRVIEGHVGAQLLIRGSGRIALTEVGALLYSEAQGILRQASHAEQVVLQAARGEAGSLSIGYVASAALSGVLPRLVYRFRREFPDVQLTMQEASMPAQLESVAQGEFDLGFIRPPVRIMPEGLTMFDIAVEPVAAVLHANHALAKLACIDVAMLADETFICTHTEEGTGFYAVTMSICQKAGFRPDVQALSSQMSTVISMVAAGFGVALIPASMSLFSPPDVVFKPLVQGDVQSRLAVIHRKNVRLPPVLRFIEHIRRSAEGADNGSSGAKRARSNRARG